MKMLRLVSLGLVLLMFGSLAQSRGFDEGIEYELIVPPQPTDVSDNKVEVVEVFWYGCPHCFQFEPRLQKWLKKKPANVEFIRIPATGNRPLWNLHARMFYTAEMLGVGDKLHQKIFDEYHINKNLLDNEAAIRSFFVKHGVKGEEFDNTFNSFAVETKLNRAIERDTNYGITVVPTMVVNGRYRTSDRVAGHSGALEVVDFLIQKESR
ncbi:MAG: thiol:disulfide interchange protein DsbA/DsbL [Gammaproteobacteria bacterium]|nr:thiol:disulfide interchange protein DsbA/DsbL [Gammaproteobacteria bacterium]MDH5650480.1 thiol:disulfide interchange protein DsbA/DsbL [Gammaproteobacteria bacterium]